MTKATREVSKAIVAQRTPLKGIVNDESELHMEQLAANARRLADKPCEEMIDDVDDLHREHAEARKELEDWERTEARTPSELKMKMVGIKDARKRFLAIDTSLRQMRGDYVLTPKAKETAWDRIARLCERRDELIALRVKNYREVIAKEENLSGVRIGQLLRKGLKK